MQTNHETKCFRPLPSGTAQEQKKGIAEAVEIRLARCLQKHTRRRG